MNIVAKQSWVQSVQSTVGKELCSRMALKRCSSTEMRWYKKLVSLIIIIRLFL